MGWVNVVVRLMRNNLKVANVIVQFIAVFMVDNFMAAQRVTEMFFHKIAVIKHPARLAFAKRNYQISICSKGYRIFCPRLSALDTEFFKPIQKRLMAFKSTKDCYLPKRFLLCDVLVIKPVSIFM